MLLNPTTAELQQALRPLESLLRKSAKAQQKLAPGTWQHAMLRDNLNALRLATALMRSPDRAMPRVAEDEVKAALRALAAMRSRTAASRARFERGTPQHSLQHNRLQALRLAERLLKARSSGRS